MSLRLITPPATEPVTIAEAHAYLRLDGNSPETAEDALLADLIAAAREWAEGVTRRAFISQVWEATLPQFPAGTIILPRGQALGIQSVSYLDTDGVSQVMAGPTSSPAGTDYRESLGSALGGSVRPPWGNTWPAARSDEPDAVQIRYTAGYGATAAALPPSIKAAILYRIADLHEHRGSQDGAWTGIAKSSLMPYALREWP